MFWTVGGAAGSRMGSEQSGDVLAIFKNDTDLGDC